MKTSIYICLTLFVALLFTQCSKEDLSSSVNREFILLSSEQNEYFFEPQEQGVAVPLELVAVLHASERTGAVNYSFEIVGSSTAQEGVHYSVDSFSGSIDSENFSDTLVINVLPAGLEVCETVNLDLRLSGSDLERTDGSIISLALNLESSSDLAGFVDFEHVDNFAMQDLSGTAEIIALETPGEYRISDFSFGAWPTVYGIDPPAGTLKWTNICSTIRLSGTDNFGDVWQMDEVLESDGPVFSFRYSNTYGEFGTVRLTRQDGRNWPLLELE